jgi:Type IV secretion system pilin
MRFLIVTMLVFGALFFLAPDSVNASHSTGLVPCHGPDCQACHFIQLGNNVLEWIITVMATICAIVIVVAGFKMATAGGNTGQISDAKSMIANTLIGFIILLAAWLIVDTVLKVFVSGSSEGTGAAEIPGFGPWNNIQCVTPPTQPPTTGGGGGGIAEQCATASNPQACVCEATPGSVWDLGTGVCVPGTPPTATTTACSIPALTPITDPLALQMEGGQTVIWNNPTLQTCVNRFIGQVGGSVTSAYRPPEYQTHLREVHTRWCTQLVSNTDPNCSALRGTVQSELNRHALSCSRPVGITSNHSSGRAVDISGIAHGSPAVLSAASANCLSWPLGGSDPVHYELRSGCTCN